MAWTISRTPSVFGNLRANVLVCTADAAESNIETGLKNVVAMSLGAVSMNSSNFHIALNSNSTGVQSYGVLGCSGFTSGDKICIVVYGN